MQLDNADFRDFKCDWSWSTKPLTIDDRSTLSNNQPKNGSGDPRECAISACSDAQATAGDPINTYSGNFDYGLVDLSLQTIAGPLSFQRSYASLATDTTRYPTPMGPGWTHNQDVHLLIDDAHGIAWFKGHTINQYQFTRHAGGLTYTPYPGVLAALTDNQDGTFTLQTADQSTYRFEPGPVANEYRLREWRNEQGFGFDYQYNPVDHTLSRVTEPLSGRYLQLTYANDRLIRVEDNTLRAVVFGYDTAGDLTGFTDVLGKTWTYAYANHRLTEVKDGRAAPVTVLSTVYDPQGRAYEQRDGNGNILVSIAYDDASHSATISDALGRTSTNRYDPGRHTIRSQTSPTGYELTKDFDANFRPSKFVDENNRTTTMAWDPLGANLTYIQDAAGYETFLQYDALNHLTQVTDPKGNSTNFAYTGHLLEGTERTDADGAVVSTTTYTYTTSADAPAPAGLLKSLTDLRGNVTTFIYDAAGQLTTIQNPHTPDSGGTELIENHLSYDDLGRVDTLTDPLGRVTKYQYNPAGQPTLVTANYDPLRPNNDGNEYNLVTEYQYDEFSGRLTAVFDPQRRQTTYHYDPAGRLRFVTNAENETTEYRYNAAGQIQFVIAPHPAAAYAADYTTEYVYDPASGQRTAIIDPTGVATGMVYNPDGTLHAVTQPLGQVLQYAYDDLLRVERVFDNLGHSTAYTYDAFGNVETVTDAYNRVTRYEYNPLNLLAAVVENAVSNPPPTADPDETNVRTEYRYDAGGNLREIYDANHVGGALPSMTYAYDDLNRLITVTDALGHATSYGYDWAGNRTSVTDANGATTGYSYDGVNRLRHIDYQDDGITEVTFTYNPSGDLVAMHDPLGSTHWTPDQLGRPLQITDPYNQTVQYAFDEAGYLATLTYPDLRAFDYHYDGAGRLQFVSEGTTPLVEYGYDFVNRRMTAAYPNGLQSVYTLDAAGQVETLLHTTTARQEFSYSYDYDLVGNRIYAHETLVDPEFVYLPVVMKSDDSLQTLSTTPETLEESELVPLPANGAPEQESTDPLLPGENEDPYPAPEVSGVSTAPGWWESLVQLVRALFSGPDIVHASALSETDYQLAYPIATPPPTTPSGDEPPGGEPTEVEIFYQYDALNRLTEAGYSTGEVYRYAYDKVGNRMTQTRPGGSTTTYRYDEANRLTCINGAPLTCAGGTALSWDNNGNLLSDGRSSYTYDPANRLATASGPAGSFTFTYNGLGHRLQQSANGVPTRYALDLAGLAQVLSDGTHTYLYGLDRFALDGPGGRDYFLPDALGSARRVITSDNEIARSQYFDPFGQLRQSFGSGASAYGFAGEWTDASGLINLRARYYDSTQGRFLTKDPFPGMLGQPATLQPYLYVVNNPVLLTDPSGAIAPLLLLGVAGGILGGGLYGYGIQVARNLGQGLCFWDALSANIHAGEIALYAAAGGLIGAGIGLGSMGVQALTGYFTAKATIGIAVTGGTALSADGDPTNEIRTGINVVYQVVQNGVTKYVGITNDFNRRAAEHLSSKGWQVVRVPGVNELSRTDARAVEQVLIEYWGLGNLFNKINSISTNNPIYSDAIQRGNEILNASGFFTK